ncbi:MAG: hypothetical protein Q7J07_01870 [Pelolinea sp.]|nr:hypothetical protein [Pelolinea sp.]
MDYPGKIACAKRDNDWASEQPTAATLVPGEQRMGSPIPALLRWGSHLPKCNEGVYTFLGAFLCL